MPVKLPNKTFRGAYRTLWLTPLLGLFGCQSVPSVPPKAPEMPACLKQPIPQTDMLTSLTQAMAAFEAGSSSMPPVPTMGAEQMRRCLLDAKAGWPR